MAEISHTQARSIMLLAQEAHVPEGEQSALAAHLEGCAECRAYLRSLETAQQLLRRSLQRRWDPVRSQVSTQQIQTALRRHTMFKKMALTAGTLAVIAVMALIVRGLAGTLRTQDFTAAGPGMASGQGNQAGTTALNPSPSEAPIATSSQLPPHEYTVVSGDTCRSIAQTFEVSDQSLLILNNLPLSCPLSAGQIIKIPYPTPTPAFSPTPESGFHYLDCGHVLYTTQRNDTLTGIAARYGVPVLELQVYNGSVPENLPAGLQLYIPLCNKTPVAGPTATLPPASYPAPNLLQPEDGAVFSAARDTVTLRWGAVGSLHAGEAYLITIVDDSAQQGFRRVEYLTEPRYVFPFTALPQDGRAHIFRWWVGTVREGPADDQGHWQWIPAGAQSLQRLFVWQFQAGAPGPTATPCGTQGNNAQPGAFQWPLPEHFLSGQDYSSAHPGLDLAGRAGESVHAAAAGTVSFTGTGEDGLGNTIIIDHGGGESSLYAHLSRMDVACGASVASGQVIGAVGQTGGIPRALLYFEIRQNGLPQNPWDSLPPP